MGALASKKNRCVNKEWGMDRDKLFNEGIMRVWKERANAEHQRARAEMELRQIDDLFERECDSLGVAEARRLREERIVNIDKGGGGPGYSIPFWQQITGLNAENEAGMNPNERAAGIALLIEKFEILIRYELRSMAKRLDEQREHVMAQSREWTDRDADGNPVSRWARPTHLWDPVRTICVEFGIAPRRLSSFCREVTGMSIWQLVDVIRAETVRKKMKGALLEFVRAWKGARALANLTPPPTPSRKGRGNNGDGQSAPSTEAEAEEIFAALKLSRRGPRFHRTSWAVSLGFSSYARMFQSLMLCYGKAPAQIEMELIEEILKEMSVENASMCVLGQNGNGTENESGIEIIKEGETRMAG
jgi:hypothetical protein